MEHQYVSMFRSINTCISDGFKVSVLIGTYIKCTIVTIYMTVTHFCIFVTELITTSVSVGLFHFALVVQHKLSFMWFLHFLLLKKIQS